MEGSPSAKGTLENYLVNSQNNNQDATPSCTVHGLLGRQDPVKRSLALEINEISKDEKKEPFSSGQMHPQTSEAFEMIQKETSQGSSNTEKVAVEGLSKGSSVSGHDAENSELKQFATDFLSLYCRYCSLRVAVYLFILISSCVKECLF